MDVDEAAPAGAEWDVDGTPDLPRSPGHVLYEKLNEVLAKGGFDRFEVARTECESEPPKWRAETLLATSAMFHLE